MALSTREMHTKMEPLLECTLAASTISSKLPLPHACGYTKVFTLSASHRRAA